MLGRQARDVGVPPTEDHEGDEEDEDFERGTLQNQLFDEPDNLTRLAAITSLSPEAFRDRYRKVVS